MLGLLLLWLFWEALAGQDSGRSFGITNLLGWLPTPIRPIDVAQEVSLGDRIGARDANWLTVLLFGSVLAMVGLALYREVEDAKRAGAERFGAIFALGLAVTSALLILGSELFFIFDTFNSRMNTIFKLYYQAWLMLSVAGGFILYELAQALRAVPAADAAPSTVASEPGVITTTDESFVGDIASAEDGTSNVANEQEGSSAVEVSVPSLALGEFIIGGVTLAGALGGLILGQDLLTRFIGIVVGAGVFFAVSTAILIWWQGIPSASGEVTKLTRLTWPSVWAVAALTVLFAAFLYPVLATYNRTSGFNNHRTLNGLDALPADQRAAIDFLNGLSGHPVVLEAPGGDYSEFGSISAATALPTLLQWRFHEVQWRGGSLALDEELNRREQAIEAIYTGDAGSARAMLQDYSVRFIVLGPREAEKYRTEDGTASAITIDQHTDLVEPVMQEGQVTILRVRPDILSQPSSGDTP
jgi:uncharacterized membrane protein